MAARPATESTLASVNQEIGETCTPGRFGWKRLVSLAQEPVHAVPAMVAGCQSRHRARRCPRLRDRRARGSPAGHRLRLHRRNAAPVRALRGDGPGHRRRPVRLFPAARLRPDHRRLHRAVLVAQRARGARERGVRRLRNHPHPDGGGNSVRARNRAARRARELRIPSGHRRLHRRRRDPHRGQSARALPRGRGAADPRRVRDDRVPRGPRRCDESAGRPRRPHHPRGRARIAAPGAASALHAARDRRGHRDGAPRERGPRGGPLGALGDSRRHGGGGVAPAFASGLLARDLPGSRSRRLRGDPVCARRGGVHRPLARGPLGAVHRRQPGVHRAGAVEHRRELLLLLRGDRIVQPERGELRSGGVRRRSPPSSPGCC